VWVKPAIVAEVAFSEVQRSPKYRSGFALRFARIVRLRPDKSPWEAATIEEVKRIYEEQFRTKAKASD
jgi:DNA ligase-1